MIIWNESLSVGVAELDRQHQRLGALINQLSRHLDSPSSSEVITDVMSGLVRYACDHFDYEEKLLSENGYPELEEHRAEHLRFCEMMAETGFEATHSEIELAPLLDYLAAWWTDHILHQDMKYRPFVSRGAGRPPGS